MPGPWQDLPLVLLVMLGLMDMVVHTVKFTLEKDADWSRLSATQAALLRWLDEEG